MNAKNTKNAETIRAIGSKHGFSEEATQVMASALAAGRGSQAQFDHSEFGGMGQWSSGGMTMIGDMFNTGLKDRVAALASELSRTDYGRGDDDGHASQGDRSFTPSSASWWPQELGNPSSSGGQNGQLYAVFPDRARLAVKRNEKVSIYDTKDHRIGGASQQQGTSSNLVFSTQNGSIGLEDLQEVDSSKPAGSKAAAHGSAAQEASPSEGDIPAKIRQLAKLRDEGHLTGDEFEGRKAKLLDRL